MPSGKAGKTFISKLARLYVVASTLECFALKACTVLQCLLLQKPHIERCSFKKASAFKNIMLWPQTFLLIIKQLTLLIISCYRGKWLQPLCHLQWHKRWCPLAGWTYTHRIWTPGVRPIGIDEVPWGIMAKAILKTLCDDIHSGARPFRHVLDLLQAVRQWYMRWKRLTPMMIPRQFC